MEREAEREVLPNQEFVASYAKKLQQHPEVVNWLTGTEPTDRHLTSEVLSLYQVGATVAKVRFILFSFLCLIAI